MGEFHYRDGCLYAEQVALETIAKTYGTPCYVYSRAALERHWCAFDAPWDGWAHLVCYAVKANGNLAVLNVLARLGSGFDIVSAGELERVLAAGGDPARVVFAGVGKGRDEMRRALAVGIHSFNVESEPELECLNEVARELGKPAPVSLRVNPDIPAHTHPYIATGLRDSKFGIPIDEAPGLYARAARMNHIRVHGVDCHIGSQITSLQPFLDAIERILELVDNLTTAGIELQYLNVGGGLGIRYRDEMPPAPADYVRELRARLGHRALTVIVEPGRAIAGNAGVLLTRVRYLKRTSGRNFAVVDAAMNDLLRVSLYDAWHEISPLRIGGDRPPSAVYDVVGPVCETSDFLGKGRQLAIASGDVLSVWSAGAYGAVMGSNYNARPRAAEVMVDGAHTHLVARREAISDLYRGEALLP